MERLFQRLNVMANKPDEVFLDYLYNTSVTQNKHVHKKDPFVLKSKDKMSVKMPIVQVKNAKM